MDEPHLQPLAWHTPTHEHNDRTTDWYWALGILAVCGVIASVLWGNILFAVLIGLSALCLGVLAARGPRECVIKIDDRGVSVDGELYPYESLHSFWILRGEAEAKLYLATNGILHPHIIVVINEPATPEAIHGWLSERVPEEESHSLGAILSHLLGI